MNLRNKICASTFNITRKPTFSALKQSTGVMSYLESHGERLVTPPVRREDRAEEIWAVGPDQLAGVVR